MLDAALAPAPAPALDGTPRKIALCLHDLSGGGAERVALALAREFRHAGHEVEIVVQEGIGALREAVPPGVRLVDFGCRRGLAQVVPLARYLREAQPDIVLSSIDHTNIIAVMAALAARRRTRLVLCLHNTLSVRQGSWRRWKHAPLPLLYRLAAPRVARFVAVSQAVARNASRAAGLAPGRVAVIHNPAIGPDFERLAAEPAAHPWFTDGAGRVSVAVGRLSPEKDHATLLRAFARHAAGEPGARLLILGEGPTRPALEALAAELGIAGRVGLPGFVANPLPAIRAAAALVLTSRQEGFGNVIVEAFGVGTPVIATDTPGARELLAGGRFGRLLPVGDAAGIAAAMASDLRAAFPAAMLRAHAAKFGAAASAAAYLALMAQVCAADRRPAP